MLFKNSTIGIASMLFFVVLVSQSRILDFLFETFLGRFLLISMILFISYTHYILGVVSVLIVIIMFNNIDYGYGYMEGMENVQKPTISTTSSTTVPTTTTSSTSSISSSLATAMNKAKDDVMSKINVSTKPSSTSTSTSSSKKEKTSTEGFDLIGTENTIKRGKQSNTIPVYHPSTNDGNVAPYDSGNAYSAF